jgi:ribose transport system permease protein
VRLDQILRPRSTDPSEFGAARRPFTDRYPALWITVALVVVMVAFSAATEGRFTNSSNVNNMLLDAAQILILAVPMTFIIITAGIDLSVGSILILSSVVAADVMARFSGTPEQVAMFQFPNAAVGIPVGVAAAIATGLLAGAVNGALIAFLRLPAFIVTLATMGVYQGIALILTGGTNQVTVPPALQTEFGTAKLFDQVPLPVLVAVVVALTGWFLLRFTWIGTHSLAIGANEEGTRRAGVRVRLHVFWLYAFAGLAAGIAGVIDLSRFAATSVEAHASDALDAISATVLGGTSLFGGIGNIPGTVVGSLLPSILQNGFIQLHIPPFWQPVVLGVFLVAAVGYDKLRRRR